MPVVDLSTSTPSLTAVSLTLTVPTGVVVEARNTLGLQDGGTTIKYFLLTSLASADTTPSSSAFTLIGGGDTTSSTSGAYAQTWTNTSAQIRYRASVIVTVAFIIITNGFVDNRGRLS